MRVAKLLLVSTLLALLFVPLPATASEVGKRFEKVVKERDLAVETFKAAEYKGHFQSKEDAERVRAKLELANKLLKEAQHELSEHRPHHADARVVAAHTLIKDAFDLSKH